MLMNSYKHSWALCYEHSWVLMSAHGHSWAFRSIQEHSWALISTHECSRVPMSAHEDSLAWAHWVMSAHELSRPLMSRWHYTLQWFWVPISAQALDSSFNIKCLLLEWLPFSILSISWPIFIQMIEKLDISKIYTGRAVQICTWWNF